MSKIFKLPKAECKRCGYKWTPRRSNPEMCPKCKSAYWNREYERKKSKVDTPIEEIEEPIISSDEQETIDSIEIEDF